MKIIDRYLGKTILHTTLLVLFLLMGLSVFITLIRELNNIGAGNYHLLGVLGYVLLDLPQQLYAFFPIACLLGVLLGLGLLASNSELIILRTSGLSVGRVAWGVLKTTLLLLVVATLIGEGVAPFAEHTAESYKALLISRGQTLKTNQGVWVRDGQDFLYIRSVIGGNYLEGVSRYQFDNQHRLVKVSFAEKGFYESGRWVMQGVVESQINLTAVKTQQLSLSYWLLTINPNLLHITQVEPSEMSLKQLYDYLKYLRGNNLSTSNYMLAFWQRLLQPLATLVMVWLAVPFVFGPLRSATMGLRIIAGAVVGFSFYLLNQFFGPFIVVYQLPPAIAAMLPIAIFALAAYGFQRRII